MQKLLNLFELFKSNVLLKCIFQLLVDIFCLNLDALKNLNEFVQKLQWIFSCWSNFNWLSLNLCLLRQKNRLHREGLVEWLDLLLGLE